MRAFHGILGTFALILLPAPLFAHEGHGFAGTIASLVHWLTDSYHLVLLAAIVIVAVAVPLAARAMARRDRNDVHRAG